MSLMAKRVSPMGLALIFLALPISTFATLHYPQETHLANVRQLTFGGQSAEAYFSFDNKYITFQSSNLFGTTCDQIYRMDLTQPPQNQTIARLSTGLGVCTCSFFMPDNKHVLYAGTFQQQKVCPPKKCQTPEAQTDSLLNHLCNTSYTWDIYPEFDIFVVNEYGKMVKQLTNVDGYDAEGTLNAQGDKIVFTSLRTGDPELYTMNLDGSGVTQITNTLGYDGGAFFSPDGTKLIFRASRPNTTEEITTYKQLLHYDLVSPTAMELFVVNVDGTNMRQITHLGGASWAPFYLPDNKRIIFSSNFNSTAGFGAFDLYTIYEDGTGLERITFDDGHFDSFPMFSYGGAQLVWGSSRNGTSPYDLNLFIADWIDDPSAGPGLLHYPQETHLSNVRQLTFGGQNAEAYFSFDDHYISFQSSNYYGTNCDQIYRMDLTLDPRNQTIARLSTGNGACTCSYFMPDNSHVLYAGSFQHETTCQIKQCQSQAAITNITLNHLCDTSYTWDIFPDFDIFVVNQYGNLVSQLTNSPGYDAEGTLSPAGDKIVFTSIRSGDLELYTMNIDGSNVTQITNTLGYDGGAFFSPDGTKLIFRASRPNTTEEIAKYKQLLSYNLVSPTAMELFVVNVDGTNMRQITHLGGASWAPFYLPDNKRIIFSSNFNSTAGFGAFDLYTIYEDGTGLERITFDDGHFDSFPMFSYSGKQLVWGSSRNGQSDYDLNLFIADWVDDVPTVTAPTTSAPITTTTTPSSGTSIRSKNASAALLVVFMTALIVFIDIRK
uniref:Uncharacterized protein n=1 Tax=Plectus sambesii TaxID=2011161 RepID=A0A914UYP0_9BILA